MSPTLYLISGSTRRLISPTAQAGMRNPYDALLHHWHRNAAALLLAPGFVTGLCATLFLYGLLGGALHAHQTLASLTADADPAAV